MVLKRCTKYLCKTYETNLKMASWNCNGNKKLDVCAFEDRFKGRDIIDGQNLYLYDYLTWDSASA